MAEIEREIRDVNERYNHSNNGKKNENDDSDNEMLLKPIDREELMTRMIEIGNKQFQELIRSIYIIICIIIIFISLLGFINYQKLSSIFIIISIILLQFKKYLLSFIYEACGIDDRKQI